MMRTDRLWNPDRELMDADRLDQLRLDKLRKQLDYIYQHSEFYREKFQDAGAHPSDIRDMDTFRQLPVFLDKEVHRRSQEDSMAKYGHGFGTFVCTPMDRLALVSSTSGTTGAPTYYLFTKHDLDVQAEVAARQIKRTGCGPGDIILHGAAMSGLYLAGAPLIYYGFYHQLGTMIPLGAEPGAQKLLETLLVTRATALIATPSYLNYLHEAAPDMIGRDTSELGIRILFAIGEPGAGLPEVRKKLNEAYQAEVYDLIGPGTNFAAVSCDHETYQGMHVVSADYAIHEDVIDPVTKKPLKIENGVIGEQIRTALDREAGPFVRYSVGDMIQIFTDPCPCGLPGHRIKVVGRVDDMLIVKGVNVFPGGIKNVITSFVPRVTGEFRIVLTEAPPRVVPPLKLKVERGTEVDPSQIEDLKKALGQELHARLRVRPDIEILPPETLARATKKTDWFERLYQSD